MQSDTEGSPVTWTFDTAIVGTPTLIGVAPLTINGDNPVAVDAVLGNQLNLDYPEDLITGDPWSITSAPAIAFAGGKTLAIPASGTCL